MITNRRTALLLFALAPAACGGGLGMNVNDGGGWQPADPVVAVSPTHVVQAVNSAVRVARRSDGFSLTFAATAILQHPGCIEAANASGRIVDPKIQYDPNSGRFFLAFVVPNFIRQPGSVPMQGGWCLAVTSSNDPLFGTWYSYYFPLRGTPLPFVYSDCETFGVCIPLGLFLSFPDFDNIYVGPQHVVLTGFPANIDVNRYADSAASSFRVVRKSDLIAGVPALNAEFHFLLLAAISLNAPSSCSSRCRSPSAAQSL
jgi:hypothetical protein